MQLPPEQELQNPDETLVFRYDVKEWFSPYPFNYFAFAYKNRISLILEMCRKYLHPGQKLLDIGCAQGNLAITLAEQGYDVTACDINPNFIEYAKRKQDKSNVNFITGNAFEVLPYVPSYHLILATEIIEHVAHPEDLLSKIHHLLLPGGICILTTPNGGYFKNTLPSYTEITQMMDRSELEARQFKPEGEDHLFLYTGPELAAVVDSGPFQRVSLEYLNSLLPSVLHRLLGYLKLSYTPQFWYDFDRALCHIPGFKTRFSSSLIACLQKRI